MEEAADCLISLHLRVFLLLYPKFSYYFGLLTSLPFRLNVNIIFGNLIQLRDFDLRSI